MTWDEVRKTDIRDLVQDPLWQKLRKSFLGTWTVDCAENAFILEKFLEKFNDTPQFPKYCRIVYNYLTGSYFRINDYKICKEVKILRKRVAASAKQRSNRLLSLDDII
ncbi:MAG: hypothetical protein QXV17_13475 [Candidatus Micrarchaeaceae archaeon]